MSYVPQIAVEGGDLTGKTTFQKALFPVVGKDVFVSDRNVLTQLMYSIHFNRHLDLHSVWRRDLADYLVNNGMILLTCLNENIIKRFKQRGDDRYDLDEILAMNSMYNAAANDLKGIPYVKVIEADGKSVAQTIKEAESWATWLPTVDMCSKVGNLQSLIDVFGLRIGKTKELRNITLKDTSKSIKPSQFVPLLEYAEGYAKQNTDHSEYAMAIEHYLVFYKAFKEKLLYVMMKERKMYLQDPLSTRRFHVTNDQGGCISTLGITFRRSTELSDKIDMYITANFRSSDIVILPFDLAGVYRTIYDIITPNTAIPILGKKFTNKIDRFYFNINIESAHILDSERLSAYDNDFHRTIK